MRYLNSCAAVALALSLTACGRETPAEETQKAAAMEETAPAPIPCESDGITASDAWVRAARAGQPTTAAYLTICNGGAKDSLVSVAFSGAAAVEIHTSSMGENGLVVMSPATGGIPLPTGELVKLEPGVSHIMLIGVTYGLKEEESVPMTLTFAHAKPQEVIFHIKNAMEEGNSGGH